MSFNISKCNFLIMGNPKSVKLENVKYLLKNELIEEVDSTRYLRVDICDDLKWGKHIMQLLTKHTAFWD